MFTEKTHYNDKHLLGGIRTYEMLFRDKKSTTSSGTTYAVAQRDTTVVTTQIFYWQRENGDHHSIH